MTDPYTVQWIRRFPADRPHSGVRLVCLPHAGGSAGFYEPLATALRGRLEVQAIQYPGRQNRIRQTCLDSVADLAAAIAGLAHDWHRPYALFGHSMGAAIAYEMALLLQDAGTPPVHLFASARRGPMLVREEKVHLLDDRGFAAELLRLGETGAAVLGNEELRQLLLPMIRSDYKAIETYRCTRNEVLKCPITALVSSHDPYVAIEEARGWQPHAGGVFALHQFDGGHFYLTEHLAQVADIVAAELT